ncbi:hypothetical protein COL55_13330 [Bacillus toyonensis]|nr:hypothetical protein COL55_13330 [Bacillus toyonensis]
MIKVTVKTKQGYNEDLYFESVTDWKHWKTYMSIHPKSTTRLYGWATSVMIKDITRVISVEEEN